MKKIFPYSLILITLAVFMVEDSIASETEIVALTEEYSDNNIQSVEKKSSKEEGNEYKPVMQYEDYLYLNNGAYANINPSFVKDIPLEQLASLNVSYGVGMGDFHNVDEAEDCYGLIVDVYGLKKIDKVSFEGGISYRNAKENDRRFNSTIYQNRLNPFILADTLFSDYSIEQFSIDGRFSWEPIKLIRFGINASYQAGAISDEQDPRLKADGMTFTVNPGIDFKVSDYVKIGATGGIRLLSESADYMLADNSNKHNSFLMKGFGLYYLEEATEDRKTKGLTWFSALQVYLNRPGYTNLLNFGVEQNREKAEDGDKMFVGGDFRNLKFFANNRFSFSKGKYVHNFEIAGEYNNVDGIWYDQKYIIEGTQQWETMFKSIIYEHKLWKAQLSYRLDVLNNAKTPSWTMETLVDYTNSDADNYPDGYKQSYQNLAAKVMLAKNFSIRKSILSFNAGGCYATNLESDIFIDDNVKFKDKYTIPMFEYLTADYYSVNGRISTRIPIVGKKFTSFIGAYIEASTQRYIGDFERFNKTAFNQFGGGINYTF